MEGLIIRECRLEEVEAVHQLDLEWEAEAVTYGLGPSSEGSGQRAQVLPESWLSVLVRGDVYMR